MINRLQSPELLDGSRDLEHQQTITRAAARSVDFAIKRLKKAYYMLDTGIILNQASALTGQLIGQGREVSAVIDKLKSKFQTR